MNVRVPIKIIETAVAPQREAKKVAKFRPDLLQTEDHHLCPGCGEPVAIRLVLEVIEDGAPVVIVPV